METSAKNDIRLKINQKELDIRSAPREVIRDVIMEEFLNAKIFPEYEGNVKDFVVDTLWTYYLQSKIKISDHTQKKMSERMKEKIDSLSRDILELQKELAS